MSSLNKVILIGYLGKDPEVKYSQGGAPVATFSMATSESWNKDGQRQERTEWHNIVAWNKLADICKQYLSKGRQVYIEGRIQSREYTDRDGNKRRVTEIIASHMVMLGSRGDGGQRSAEPGQKPAAAAGDNFGDAGITDNDIPF